MTVAEIVKKYLKDNGYDGLYTDECGCIADNLSCCDNPCDQCSAGYFQHHKGKHGECDGGDDCQCIGPTLQEPATTGGESRITDAGCLDCVHGETFDPECKGCFPTFMNKKRKPAQPVAEVVRSCDNCGLRTYSCFQCNKEDEARQTKRFLWQPADGGKGGAK